MGVSVSESNRLSSMIQEKNLELSIKSNTELKTAIDNNPKYKEVFEYARVIEGLARQPGMHAGGVIIASSALVNWTPLFKQARTDSVMTQFDMKYVESVGLIKIDILGLRTLTVLQEACQLIEKYHGKKIHLWEIPDGDEKTYRLFHAGETTDVFQFESQGMQDYLRKLKPTCIEDLIAMTALYRPGPMNNIDSFIHRKHGKEPINYPHPMLKEILDVTYGIIVYQEQVMRIAQKMAGFSLGQADTLRYAMGKKVLDKMESMRVKFLEGALKQNIRRNTAEEVFALIEKFAEYGFNKAHATVYAHVSYQAAYLKANYPLEYMTAVLTSHIGEKDKFLSAINEAQRLGVKVLPPDINRSDIKCAINDRAVNLGLSVIANVGKAADIIIESRQKEGSFKSIYDLCRRVDLRVVNKKTLESLVMAGTMDSLPGTRAQLFTAIESAIEYGSSFQKDRLLGQTNLFANPADSSEKDNQGKNAHLSVPEPELPDVPPWPYNQLLAKEKEVLNFYMSGHPLDHYKDEIVGFTTVSLKESILEEIKDGTSVIVGGVVTSVKSITQRDGKQMAFLQLEDFNGTIELIAFADAYAQHSHLCAVDAMVLVRGVLQKKEGNYNYKVIVEKIMPLSESREKLAKSIHIKMRTQALEEEFIKEVYSLCCTKKGSCNLIIHLITHEENEYKILSGNLQISPLKDVVESLRATLGRENVWISQKAN
jgi:DNA polymerase-3 subunit alpha